MHRKPHDKSFLSLSSSRMVSRKAVAALLVVHVAAMLASQTEAFVPIFTHSELQKIRVGSLPTHTHTSRHAHLPCVAQVAQSPAQHSGGLSLSKAQVSVPLVNPCLIS